MNIWFNNYNWEIDEVFWNELFCRKVRILILVGSSGAGKSTITDYLYNNFEEYYEIRNVTTRKPREYENKTHSFIFLSTEEYLELLSKRQFAWAKYGNYPYYGYPKYEFTYLAENFKIGILSFHHNGAALFAKLFEKHILEANNISFVFINGDTKLINNHSNDREGLASFNKTQFEKYQNSQLSMSLSSKGVRVLNVYNDYEPHTIGKISNIIRQWMVLRYD